MVLMFLALCLPLQAKEKSTLSVATKPIGDKRTNIAKITMSNFQGEPSWRRPLKSMQGQVLSQSGHITGLVVLPENYSQASGSSHNSHCGETFAEGTFDGEIVICQQSDVPPDVIAANLKNAGAGGMILQATQLGLPVYQRFESLPSISLTVDSYFLLKNWVKYSKSGTTLATIGE